MESSHLPMMAQYALSPHVHVCRTRDHAVLLDLQGDKYLAFSPQQEAILASRVLGWPATASSTPTPESDASKVEPLIQQMTQRGLLRDVSQGGRRATPVAIPEATATLVGEYTVSERKFGLARLANFLMSTAFAVMVLRYRGLGSAVGIVQARKARLVARPRKPFSFEAARDAVLAFERLRPLVFAARDGCLLDSFALVEFLARERLFPRWVIGVRTRPFGAHSWVQEDCVVLNDLPENVRKFTPILAL